MSIFIKFFKAAAILSDGLHVAVWLLWIALCASGLLKIHEIDPDFSGLRAIIFYGMPFVMIAVLIGGNLFGIVGMIFFIPLAAVCYQLLKEYTNRKLRDKNTIVPETAPAAEDGAHQATEK